MPVAQFGAEREVSKRCEDLSALVKIKCTGTRQLEVQAVRTWNLIWIERQLASYIETLRFDCRDRHRPTGGKPNQRSDRFVIERTVAGLDVAE